MKVWLAEKDKEMRTAASAVLVLVSALFCLAGPAKAEPKALTLTMDELVTDEIIADIREWVNVPVVLEALRSRNEGAGQLNQSEIDRLDKQWRAETKNEDQPLITSVLANPLSSYLYRVQARSVGLLTEVFVMDRNGLNVGQSSVTSDYWQGDEAKFQKTVDVGPGTVFVDEPEFNDETATWRAQINLTIDDDSGNPVGAITVEVNLTELERRKLAGLGA
ncbi:hypothetical protein T8K17_19835 [Thalassobaculum sp. OXR-137]|uniref:hypothetical protein n=1 Tax=Thalassobaculum sp. OXR-137 TaxID=3100173 RepID=UPI002AC90A92|nr:hypothetical protein [Thalassobaculum sp. OXR-137]WPZ33473.1 hypothetical protein T8K17_19835 [Thalassobaculum sp. OXR-137]